MSSKVCRFCKREFKTNTEIQRHMSNSRGCLNYYEMEEIVLSYEKRIAKLEEIDKEADDITEEYEMKIKMIDRFEEEISKLRHENNTLRKKYKRIKKGGLKVRNYDDDEYVKLFFNA